MMTMCFFIDLHVNRCDWPASFRRGFVPSHCPAISFTHDGLLRGRVFISLPLAGRSPLLGKWGFPHRKPKRRENWRQAFICAINVKSFIIRRCYAAVTLFSVFRDRVPFVVVVFSHRRTSDNRNHPVRILHAH